MNLIALQRALRAARIQAEHTQRALQDERRRSGAASTGRTSVDFTLAPARGIPARPKLNSPHLFKGDYTETYNAYNWLHQLYRYLTQCKVSEEDFSAYARTYMSETVQAWMDAEFGTEDVPAWELFYEAVVERYVPKDHDDRLERMFSRMKQRDTLLHYVEQWQVLDSALTFSHVQISNRRKISSFVEGMKEKEDKYKVLHDKPANLKDVYATIQEIRRVKVLTRETKEGPPQQSRGRAKTRKSRTAEQAQTSLRRHFRKLEGKAKKKAWDEGACLNCGAKDHFIAQCPTLQTSIKTAVKKYAKLFFKDKNPKNQKPPSSDKATAGSKKKYHKMKNPTGTQKQEEQEEDSSSSEDSSDAEETCSETDLSASEASGGGEEENSRSESEG
jgi:hypothetical protein